MSTLYKVVLQKECTLLVEAADPYTAEDIALHAVRDIDWNGAEATQTWELVASEMPLAMLQASQVIRSTS